MKRGTTGTITAVLLSVSAGVAGAQESSPPAPVLLTAATRIPGPAREQLARTENPALMPGDTIAYEFLFTNLHSTTARNLLFQRPMPGGLRYVVGSATASRPDVVIEFSLDGGRTFAPSPTVEALVGGAWVERPAPPEKYTHVRWIVVGLVKPGDHLTGTLRAIVPPGGSDRSRLARSTGETEGSR